jgi:hypothetical protein
VKSWSAAKLGTSTSSCRKRLEFPDGTDPTTGQPLQNALVFGWSRSADPTDLGDGGWCKFRFDTGYNFPDYPKLGDFSRYVVIGDNWSHESSEAVIGSEIPAIAKPAAGDNSCARPTMRVWAHTHSTMATADGEAAGTPVAANSAVPSALGYVAPADYGTHNQTQIQTWYLSEVKGVLKLRRAANATVSRFKIPPSIPQPNSDRRLDALDARLTQAVAARDPQVNRLAMWTQHTVRASGGRTQVRWYELLPRSSSPRRQQGNIANSQHSVFTAAISPALNGDALIKYNIAGASLRAQVRARTRFATTGLNRMTSEITLVTSEPAAGAPETSDDDFTCYDDRPAAGSPVCRWGDYAGATPDPTQSNVVWGSNQFLGPRKGGENRPPHWRTQNFAGRDPEGPGVTATVTFDARDNPRIDKRVRWRSVPVQRKTTVDKVRLKPKR